MSISLATKGVICPIAAVELAEPSFSPILDFDVELVLDRPIGLQVINEDFVPTPTGFAVEEI